MDGWDGIDNRNVELADEKEAQNRAANNVAAYFPHDCHAWNVQHYTSGPEYKYSSCGVCGQITGFQWRGWWMRLRGMFTSEPRITPVVDRDP